MAGVPTVDDKLNSFMSNADDDPKEGVSANPEEPQYEPRYRVISEEKIPVAKAMGKVWKSRYQAGKSAVIDGGHLDRWNSAIKYYRNDHQVRRDNSDVATDTETGTRLTTKGKESENLVFANTTSLVPAVYAKNPRCEISCEGREDLEDFCDVLERLVNILIAKRSAPGVNLKPVARKGVILATLTNYAYAEVGFTKKEQSNENDAHELEKLAQKLEKAKNRKEVEEIEAELEAVETKIDMLRPAGPFVKLRRPHDVIIDPDANNITDARWVMIAEYVSTSFLKVIYGKKNEDGKYESIFRPGYVLKLANNGAGAVDEDLINFTMFDTSGTKTAKDYGFDNDDTFSKAQRTKVWYVWDKATRRVYMFNDDDWTWPIWVWNDPYGYDDFFPLEELEFYTDPWEYHGRGEVTYYMDMQDAIDAINNEVAKTREFIVGKLIYNKTLLPEGEDQTIIESLLDGTTKKRAVGVRLPADFDLNKAIFPLVPQSAHALNTTIFDKERLIQAIDRVSSVTNVMRGVEYKTNTTNRAIESYESNTNTRLDEKIDAVEDWIGNIAWKIAQVCLAFMPDDQVAELVGAEAAQTWTEKKDVAVQMRSFFTIRVVGGSALKPTSVTKKQQAAQLGQILGQFARTTPVALLIALKVMEQAYDEVIIQKKDWEMIMQSIQQQMQQPQGGAPQQNDSNDRKGEGGKPQQGQVDPNAAAEQAIQKLEMIIDSLPMELKKNLAAMIAADTPIKAAIMQVVQEMQSIQPQMTGA